MNSIYLYADAVSREVLLDDRQKIVLIGSDFGYGNFGDVLQHVNSLNIARQSKSFATVSVMAANAIGFAEFPAWARNSYSSDAIIFVADYPLILDEWSPRLYLVCEIHNLAAVLLYGGGFLNHIWGDYVLGVTDFFLRLAPHATYLVSGQQVTSPYQSRVVEHIKAYKPVLFGVRDALSCQCLREVGFDPLFSFDDATEALITLTETLPLRRGPGLLLHLNSSDYTANTAIQHSLGGDMRRLKASAWTRDGVTLFQAFRDGRHEVNDSRETVKKLDTRFPFADLRVIELVPLAYSGKESQIAKPIVGEIGYSCSYHVTLWLQLAGIPCWLRSSNPYYDQKSRALQVTQNLESFLDEPRLADHRSNMERRAQWRALFNNELANVPDVQNVCKVPQSDNGPAPWPFFFKGTPSLEDKLSQAIQNGSDSRTEIHQLHERLEALNAQLTEVGDEAHMQRSRAEAAETSLNHAQDEAHMQRSRAEAAETSLNHAQTEIDQLNNQVNQVLHSRSWRLTKPIRAISRYFRNGHFDSQGRVGVFALIQSLGRRLPVPVGLRNCVGRFLAKFRRQGQASR